MSADVYQVIVVGAGHAGIEAAAACSRMGVKTLLLTMNVDQIGAMSCNPAVGGLGKSQLAREVDALGGHMCRVADKSAMQYRLLNESKGPAVRATRVQVDRHEYRAIMKNLVESLDHLSVKQGQVSKLLIENGKLLGCATTLGQIFYAPNVVITTGTFMNGKAHIGKMNFASGRAGEPPSVGLSDYLSSIGIRVGRLKTGTVPRVDRRTIDFSKTEEQISQESCPPISIFSEKKRSDLVSAHIAHTNAMTHEIIRSSLEESPLYAGIIQSRGPRYCPSVEDKIVRFADKTRHQVFLEREGRLTNEVYAGGLSTSLPYDCQLAFLRSIPGLERVEIIRPGYAIEYDYIDATQLSLTLETKELPGLFFAGQVNGTSGYEEAASQGIYAGINAARRAQEKEPFVLSRSESYIGVMVDDLVTKGTTEPYRMFTSRAEWRLLLRQDNADTRLLPKAQGVGLISSKDFEKFEARQRQRANLRSLMNEVRLTPTPETNAKLEAMNQAPIKTLTLGSEILRRPGITYSDLHRFMEASLETFSPDDLSFVETEIKYEGYIRQSEAQLNQIGRMENLKIPTDFLYESLSGLPRESVEKLSRVRPINLGQASRISGITPATISVLAIHLSRKLRMKQSSAKGTCAAEREFDVIEEENITLENRIGGNN